MSYISNLLKMIYPAIIIFCSGDPIMGQSLALSTKKYIVGGKIKIIKVEKKVTYAAFQQREMLQITVKISNLSDMPLWVSVARGEKQETCPYIGYELNELKIHLARCGVGSKTYYADFERDFKFMSISPRTAAESNISINTRNENIFVTGFKKWLQRSPVDIHRLNISNIALDIEYLFGPCIKIADEENYCQVPGSVWVEKWGRQSIVSLNLGSDNYIKLNHAGTVFAPNVQSYLYIDSLRPAGIKNNNKDLRTKLER